MAQKVLLVVDDAWLGQAVQMVVAGREKMAVQVETVETGGGGGTPAEPDRSVQFNDGGAFGGDEQFLYAGQGEPAVYALIPADNPGWYIVDESNVTVGALRRLGASSVLELVATGVPLLLRTEDVAVNAEEVTGQAGAVSDPGATGATATWSGGASPAGTGGWGRVKGGDGSLGGAATTLGGESNSPAPGGSASLQAGSNAMGAVGAYMRAEGGGGPGGGHIEAQAGTSISSAGGRVRIFAGQGAGAGGNFSIGPGGSSNPNARGLFTIELDDATVRLFFIDPREDGTSYNDADNGSWLRKSASGATIEYLSPEELVLAAWSGAETWTPERPNEAVTLSAAAALTFDGTVPQGHYQLRVVTAGFALTFTTVVRWLGFNPTIVGINSGEWVITFFWNGTNLYGEALQVQP